MNCTKCNEPNRASELIDGLCHGCTAKALVNSRRVEKEMAETLLHASGKTKAVSDAAHAMLEFMRGDQGRMCWCGTGYTCEFCKMQDALALQAPPVWTDEQLQPLVKALVCANQYLGTWQHSRALDHARAIGLLKEEAK